MKKNVEVGPKNDLKIIKQQNFQLNAREFYFSIIFQRGILLEGASTGGEF